jgi:phospholipase C
LKRALLLALGAGVVLAAVLVGTLELRGSNAAPPTQTLPVVHGGIHKIKHIVVIMQENRSFDSYFGTYPGADGIPGLAGNPGKVPCLPDPRTKKCVRPYHDTADRNSGGPHGEAAANSDIAGGKMNGFQRQARIGSAAACRVNPDVPGCSFSSSAPDVMGYHDASEIPNYWAYAHHFVLQDHMFESVNSWSLPAHLAEVSGWSASCTKAGDPMSCKTALSGLFGAHAGRHTPADFPWTDLTYLLHRYGVSWRYYIAQGNAPDCANDQMFCKRVRQRAHTPNIWNPLPRFDTVREDGQLGNIVPLDGFFQDIKAGTLPSVSWIVPSQTTSEHPPGLVSAGQTYVTNLINTIMRSPDWKSTAIFVSWDDWGGFYDHVKPPVVNAQGYGIRVPGLVISPYARTGFIDHQTLSNDAYLKFIEDDFLGGRRINPRTDGRPDSRPFVAENAKALGNLAMDFDFNQKPRRALILPLHPPFS